MKAVVLRDIGVLDYTDVPEPEPVGDRSVLVRVAAVGVCGSDLLRFSTDLAYHFPLVMGHEFSAIVEEPPAGSAFSAGDRVSVFPLIPDPRDPLSVIGEYAVSSGYDYFGSRRDGAMAERLHVPEANLLPLPPEVPLVHAAVVEPAAVALHGMLKFDLPPHATALVIGCGPIGAFAAQWLRIRGCSEVYVADIDPRKREILAGLGFPVIDAASVDTVEAVRGLTHGRGVDCAVEASGIPKTLVQALTATTTFGQVMLLGDIHGDVVLTGDLVSSLLRREVRIYGTWNSKFTPPGRSDWDMVLAHMRRGDLSVEPLISHTPSLSDVPQLFADMVARRVWQAKVVIAVSGEARAERRAGSPAAEGTAASAALGDAA